MDANRNAITSVEHFRDELQSVLRKAQRNLERDGSLAEVALLSGHPVSKHLLLINVPSETVNARLRAEVRHGSYECVTFIALAVVSGIPGQAPAVYRATTDHDRLKHEASLCILIEGSHRDFGMHATHVPFRYEGNGFVFGKIQSGALMGGAAVADLWPARRLNG